jgi:hypothetical protein
MLCARVADRSREVIMGGSCFAKLFAGRQNSVHAIAAVSMTTTTGGRTTPLGSRAPDHRSHRG